MSQSDMEDFETPKVYPNQRQHLVTYSKTDLSKFPTCESFCDALISSFNGSGKVVAEYQACCFKEHGNSSGYYYKLSGPKRWDPVKKKLLQNYGITVNFSESHEYYYSAYTYFCKKDPNVFKSPNHLDLREIDSPATKKCMKAYQQKCRKRKFEQNNEKQNNKSHEQNSNKTVVLTWKCQSSSFKTTSRLTQS